MDEKELFKRIGWMEDRGWRGIRVHNVYPDRPANVDDLWGISPDGYSNCSGKI